MYIVYTERNAADTTRDSDDITRTDLKSTEIIDEAIDFSNKYILKHFFNCNGLQKCGDLNNKIKYQAIDFCSYGAILYIKEI